MWSAFAGSQPTAVAVLNRWPDLRALGSARRATLTGVVAAHTRAVPDVPARVEAIRAAARAWTDLWDGHLDLDALAWEVAEHLHDMGEADQRIARATAQATGYWADLYGDDLLLGSVPGMGPTTAPTVRAFLGDGSAFATAKATASYVGMNPSTWSSGTVVGRHRSHPSAAFRFTHAAIRSPNKPRERTTLLCFVKQLWPCFQVGDRGRVRRSGRGSV